MQRPLLLAVVLAALLGAAHSFCLPLRPSLHATNRIHTQCTLTQSLFAHGAEPHGHFTGAHAGPTTGAGCFVQPGSDHRTAMLPRASRMSTVARRAVVDASRVLGAGAGIRGYTESRHRAILPGEDPLAAQFRCLSCLPALPHSDWRLFSSCHSGFVVQIRQLSVKTVGAYG